jgi:lipoprotein-releasing system permease protein
MPYELFVGWRYLYFRRRSGALLLGFLLGAALCGGGVALFFLTEYKAIAAINIGVGGLALAAAALLAFFSPFTAISMLGVAIGVSILIWVLSVTSGFQEEFRRKVLGVNAHILILKYGLEFSEYRDVMRSSEAIKEVVAAAPFVFNEMMIARGQRLSGVLVKGVDPRLVGRVLDLPQHVEKPHRIEGRDLSEFLTPSTDERGQPLGPPGLVIGRDLAEKLELEVGDMVRLISPLSGLDIAGWAPAGEIPRTRDFRVAAIFFSGFNEYDRRLVYVHMREVQTFLDQGDVVTGVDLKINDVFEAKPLAKRVLKSLGGPPYRTIDWSELNHNLFTALAIQKLFLRIFIGLIVVVAAFNVLAALAVLVIRKTREIAILKSLGTSSGGVARIFMSTGVIVWIFGAGLGLLWGYLGGLVLARYRFPLDPKVYHISELPVRMDPAEFLLTAGFALVLCLLAVLYPAIRAGLLHPVEGLRYE